MPEWTKKLQEVVSERTGKTVVDRSFVELAEASDVERRAMQKELDLMGYYVLDHMSGSPQEVRPTERRRMAAQSRMVWMQDPVAGANVDLSCQFIFGRGVPKPKAADEKVQEVIDEAWDDPDNKAALTSFPAQVALCTDLVIQSNLFILFFEGDDGKLKLGILDHDAVEDAVRDSSNRLRVLYYVARQREYSWDYNNDRVTLKSAMQHNKPRVMYYQSLAATDAETGELESDDPACPPDKLADGLVYHIAINKGTEQVFGIPAMRRVVKWMAALNDFMAARVDMTQAAAAFIMRRTIKGSPQQVANIAAKAISRQSTLASQSIDDPSGGVIAPGPRPASILNENEAVKTEPFALNTQAGQAIQDAQHDPLADRGRDLAPALPRRPVKREPGDRPGAGAAGGQEGRGVPGAVRGPVPHVRRPGDRVGGGLRQAADRADRRGARQAQGQEVKEPGARRRGDRAARARPPRPSRRSR